MHHQAQFNSESKNKNTYKNLSCPNCKSKKIIKRGFRQTQNRGKIQRYSCKDCKHRFVRDEGFYRMRNSPQKITLCLDLFFRGISTRKIQEHLQAFYAKNASWVSIYFWVIKYPRIISKFTDNLKLKVGPEVQIDEIEFHRRKHPKKKQGIDRGFHGSIDSAKAIMKGMEIYYNFITKHQAINCCPYELAVPNLKGKIGNNKWLNLIKLAKRIPD